MAVQYTKFVKNFKFTNIYSLNSYQRYLPTFKNNSLLF